MSEAVINTTQNPRRLGRSIGAVLVGMIVGAVLSIGTDAVMHAVGVLPALGQPVGDKPLLLATAYRVVYTILGCYVTARLAPYRPMAHAMTLGLVGFIVCTLGAVLTWNKGPSFGPHWYPIALVVTALPCAWLGGLLHREKSS